MLKKKGLLRLGRRGQARAGTGGRERGEHRGEPGETRGEPSGVAGPGPFGLGSSEANPGRFRSVLGRGVRAQRVLSLVWFLAQSGISPSQKVAKSGKKRCFCACSRVSWSCQEAGIKALVHEPAPAVMPRLGQASLQQGQQDPGSSHPLLRGISGSITEPFYVVSPEFSHYFLPQGKEDTRTCESGCGGQGCCAVSTCSCSPTAAGCFRMCLLLFPVAFTLYYGDGCCLTAGFNHNSAIF